MMRILFVADGRSPTALNWINYFLEQGQQVHLISTFACPADERLTSFEVIPVAFSNVKRTVAKGEGSSTTKGRSGFWGASLVQTRTKARQWLGPLTLPGAARQLREAISRLQPDLVHAMRIPYEGMLTALADPAMPLLLSVWGNDFTLHAPSTPLMAHFTRLALERASALHTDCHRDARLAREWGFLSTKPCMVLPGAGGLQPELFYPEEPEHTSTGIEAQDDQQIVINPRGIRAYVRNDTFFQAIPLVLQQRPNVRFICPTMAREHQAQSWLERLGIAESVDLLPQQTRPQMAALFRRAQVTVSPSTHDGTPNTLLEAMACGSFPVAGDIESLREWIIPGVNGLLIDPNDPQALAGAILTALQDNALRQRARRENARLISERATYNIVMQSAFEFYQELIKD